MAEIYLAHGAGGAGVERYCVLKRILRSRAHDADVVRMFLNEARLGAHLQHPNIASVYDLGTLADSYFFTMEYVHGETIRTVLQRARALGRSLPLSCVLTIIAGAAAGLDHAHERSDADGQPLAIVHRDVSPSNLMVGYEGHVKVVDFGVAKVANRDVKTRDGTIKGKICYLSPEQSRGEPVDRRSDLFSLGIVMWEMLTGTRLYQRSSDFATMTAIVHELPAMPSVHRPELPREVDELVGRLLAKHSRDRFQTAAELVEAIEHVAQRTATALSTTAVRRLVHDLFGARVEPWLGGDRGWVRGRSVTLASRPLPVSELAPTVDAPLEADLASVPDLGPVAGGDEPTASASDSADHEALDSWQDGVRLGRRVTELCEAPRSVTLTRLATDAGAAVRVLRASRAWARGPIAVGVAALIVVAGVAAAQRLEPHRAEVDPAPPLVMPTAWADPPAPAVVADDPAPPIAPAAPIRVEPPRRRLKSRYAPPPPKQSVVAAVAGAVDDGAAREAPPLALPPIGPDAVPAPPPPPPIARATDARCKTNLRDCR